MPQYLPRLELGDGNHPSARSFPPEYIDFLGVHQEPE
jgi:hypothetical protein